MRPRVVASSRPFASAPLSPRNPSSAAGLMLTKRNRLGTTPSCFLTASSRGWAADGASSIEVGVGRRGMAEIPSGCLRTSTCSLHLQYDHNQFRDNYDN